MIKVPSLRHQRVYKSVPTHSRVKTNDKTYQGKKCQLWHLWCTCYGQLYWTNLLAGNHIHTKYCKFDHSETILGPFQKLTFLGPDPLLVISRRWLDILATHSMYARRWHKRIQALWLKHQNYPRGGWWDSVLWSFSTRYQSYYRGALSSSFLIL
jgi:hypothetical protein